MRKGGTMKNSAESNYKRSKKSREKYIKSLNKRELKELVNFLSGRLLTEGV